MHVQGNNYSRHVQHVWQKNYPPHVQHSQAQLESATPCTLRRKTLFTARLACLRTFSNIWRIQKKTFPLHVQHIYAQLESATPCTFRREKNNSLDVQYVYVCLARLEKKLSIAYLAWLGTFRRKRIFSGRLAHLCMFSTFSKKIIHCMFRHNQKVPCLHPVQEIKSIHCTFSTFRKKIIHCMFIMFGHKQKVPRLAHIGEKSIFTACLAHLGEKDIHCTFTHVYAQLEGATAPPTNTWEKKLIIKNPSTFRKKPSLHIYARLARLDKNLSTACLAHLGTIRQCHALHIQEKKIFTARLARSAHLGEKKIHCTFRTKSIPARLARLTYLREKKYCLHVQHAQGKKN